MCGVITLLSHVPSWSTQEQTVPFNLQKGCSTDSLRQRICGPFSVCRQHPLWITSKNSSHKTQHINTIVRLYFPLHVSVIPGCWEDISPTKKETSYSDKTLNFASHSKKKKKKVARPTRTPRQQWPLRRKKNGDLSIVFFSRVGLRTYQHPCTYWPSTGVI
jgi:hypothetical protein